MESQDNFINESLILVFLDLFVCVAGVGGGARSCSTLAALGL